DPTFIPLNLKWANTGETVSPRIPARGMSKHCDLCFVQQDSEEYLTFVTEVFPNPVAPDVWPTRKEAGSYKLDVAVVADNADPVRKTLLIEFGGKWFDDADEM